MVLVCWELITWIHRTGTVLYCFTRVIYLIEITFQTIRDELSCSCQMRLRKGFKIDPQFIRLPKHWSIVASKYACINTTIVWFEYIIYHSDEVMGFSSNRSSWTATSAFLFILAFSRPKTFKMNWHLSNWALAKSQKTFALAYVIQKQFFVSVRDFLLTLHLQRGSHHSTKTHCTEVTKNRAYKSGGQGNSTKRTQTWNL